METPLTTAIGAFAGYLLWYPLIAHLYLRTEFHRWPRCENIGHGLLALMVAVGAALGAAAGLLA